MMTFEEFREDLIRAAQNGTLMTPKHDPNNLGVLILPYRSVLSYELSSDLMRFINSENYTVNEYRNIDRPNSPLYFEIIPKASSGFEVPSSGVTSNSTTATTCLDRLVAVSGQTQGWHLFGESSTEIQYKVQNGSLNYEGPLG